MKKSLLLVVFSLIAINSFGQISIRGSMGINFISTPSLKDYLNQNYAPSDNQVGTFSSAVNFSGEMDYNLNPNFQAGLELSYTLNSFNYSSTFSNYEFSYGIFSPSVTVYYVIPGKGYNFKFGGGAGPRFSFINETVPPLTTANSYKSTGIGFLLRIEGNTALSDNLFANIGADLRYDINGEPGNNGNNIYNNGSSANVNLNSFSIGLRLGVSYIF